MMLLSENAGCPQCGSLSGRRWRSYSGIELCTDCEWDYFSELNGRKLLDAQSQLREPVVPQMGARPKRKSGLPVPNPLQVRSTAGHHVVCGSTGSPSRPSDTNSICRACGHIFYSRILEHCLRCRGLCEHRSDHDLTLMGRYAQRFIEAER